jgi:hypothetical protein
MAASRFLKGKPICEAEQTTDIPIILESPMIAFMRALSHFSEVKHDTGVPQTLVTFSGIGLLASLVLVLNGIDLGAILF